MELTLTRKTNSVNEYLLKEEEGFSISIYDNDNNMIWCCCSGDVTMRCIEAVGTKKLLYIDILYNGRYVGMVCNPSRIKIEPQQKL